MARSIHRTRASLAREKAFDRPDPKKVERIEQSLGTKRRIKRHVRQERKPPRATELPPISASAIAIRIVGRASLRDFAATEEDIRSVLEALPPGTLNGVRVVELRTGADEKCELVPGIEVNQVLGRYRVEHGRIELFAYSRDAAAREWDTLLPWLKVRVLSTLVHEVGHHEDHSTRIARGRWRMDDRDKGEAYAERRQHAMTHGIVLPYLTRRYGADILALESWIEQAAGVRVPFQRLVDDARVTTGNGFVRWISPSHYWLGRLVKCLREGRPSSVVRREFANQLHYADEYELALLGIRGALSLAPDDAEAVGIEACVLKDLGRYEEAALRAERAVELDPTSATALERLATVYKMLERWQDALEALERALPRASGKDLPGLRLDHARARMELGALDGLVDELTALSATRYRRIADTARGLCAIALLRLGRFEETLVVAEPLRRSRSHWRPLAQAAAAEAARRLGRSEAPVLDAEAVKRLRWWRFGPWIDRLLAEYPDALA